MKTVTKADGEVALYTVRPKLVMDSGADNYRVLVPWRLSNFNEGTDYIKFRTYWSNIPTTGATFDAFSNIASGFEVDTEATEWVDTYSRFIKSSVLPPNECCQISYNAELDINQGRLMLDAGKSQVLTFMVTCEVITDGGTADVHSSLSWKEY